MFIYINDLENSKIKKEMMEKRINASKKVNLIFNDQIKFSCPLENAIYLSEKIKKIFETNDFNETANKNGDKNNQEKYPENQENLEGKNEETNSEDKIPESSLTKSQKTINDNELHFHINELNDLFKQQNQTNTPEIEKEKAFYEKQLSLLFNGYDIAISHQYLSKFKAIFKKLQISSFFKQFSEYLEIPDIHETQHEITVLRTLENFFFDLTEENIEVMHHQILSLYYQTQPEFFCLILLNQCLIHSKSIELFVYVFEQILIKIDEFNNSEQNQSQKKEKRNHCQESRLLCKMLENIIRKSLKFEGTYGPYTPSSDVAHEMFPQEYFYLCQLLYSRKLIQYELFRESFINANWIRMSLVKPSTTEYVIKIFITKDQYITIDDFTYDFTDKSCPYKHMNKESVEQLIKENKSRFIHKIGSSQNDDDYVNWISLYLDGDNPDLIADLIRRDDIDNFQRLVNGNYRDLEEFIEKCGIINRSVYERKSIVNKKLTLTEYAAFYGSVKCFKYLLINECKLDKAAKYAVAGSNSEIIHICQQHKATFDGSLLLSIRYHRWEITEWLLETLNVQFDSIAVIKLCINCGNFMSLHFIIEKILSQKLGTKDFVNEIIVVQSMFRLKFIYGYLMTKYKAGVTITFDDNKAIFWHEHFFSYIFDDIKPKEIHDETENQNQKDSENENNKNDDSMKSNQNEEEENNDYEYDDEDEINQTLQKMRPKVFYEIPPEMIELIYILQNNFFQINRIPYRSLSPIHASIDKNDIKFYELITSHSEIDMNFNTYEFPSPLLYSIKMRNEAIFNLLFNDERVMLNSSSSTVMFLANQYDVNDEQSEGNKILYRMLNQLLQSDRFDPNAGTSFTPQGIFTACERHEYKIIELLSISKRTDLNVRDLKGRTLLQIAIIENDKKLFDILLNAYETLRKVNLNLQTRILTDKNNFIAGVQLDKTPLMLCVEYKRWDFFDRLIDIDDVDIEICDLNHDTITMILAQKYDGLTYLKRLYEKKKEAFLRTLNIKNLTMKTPLDIVHKRASEIKAFLENCQ